MSNYISVLPNLLDKEEDDSRISGIISRYMNQLLDEIHDIGLEFSRTKGLILDSLDNLVANFKVYAEGSEVNRAFIE